MKDYINKLFQTQDHRKIMLVSLLSISSVIYMALALASLYLCIESVFWIKLSVSFLIALLLIPYLKYRFNMATIAMLLFLILEVDSAIEMLNQNRYDFVSIYTFCIIFGFFFFFKLKTALWVALLHFLFWIGLTLSIKDSLDLSDINMFITSILVLLFGIFYHLSREIAYYNHKDEEEKKVTVLKEIHHRIKNNLNMIASIIGLQILTLDKTNTIDTKEILTNSKLRIEVVAMIHEALYQHQDIKEVNVKSYINKLMNLILSTYSQNVNITIDSNVKRLHEKSMLRVGIIINELLTNSIKHSFVKSKETNIIHVSLIKNNNNYVLTYHNPYNINANIDKILHSDTLGMKLIHLTVKQMNGVLKIEQNEGLAFVITFRS